MLDSELKECLLRTRTRARKARFVRVHTHIKKTRAGIGLVVPVSALVWYYCCPPLARGGEGQMCLFYSASLKSTA